MTPDQQKAALAYRGPENHGDSEFLLPKKKQRRFIVHTIPNCPWCRLARHELRRLRLSFEMQDHPEKAERDEFKARYGVTTFPQVFIVEDGEWTRLGGYEDMMTFLKEHL